MRKQSPDQLDLVLQAYLNKKEDFLSLFESLAPTFQIRFLEIFGPIDFSPMEELQESLNKFSDTVATLIKNLESNNQSTKPD